MIHLNDLNEGLKHPSLLDRYLLDELNGTKPAWTEEQKKLYMKGVEDNTNVVTFSIKVFYTIDVGNLTGGRIGDMVDVMFENMNKRFENLTALTRAKLHCLEETTWSEEMDGSIPWRYWFQQVRNSDADAVLFIQSKKNWKKNTGGNGILGSGLAKSYETFRENMISWLRLDYVNYGRGAVHEVGHNLGLVHSEMESEAYYGRVFKEFRFALAAIGDELDSCPKEEAHWEFRSKCFKSFGKFTGGELENEARTSEKSAKACQTRCAATEGCTFFSFKAVGAGCQMASKPDELIYAKGVVGGPVACDTGGLINQMETYLNLNLKTKNHSCHVPLASWTQVAASQLAAQLGAPPAPSPSSTRESPMSTAPLSTMTR